MKERRTALAAVIMAIAASMGMAVAGLSQLGAVPVADPRPSEGTPIRSIAPEPTPPPSPAASPSPTAASKPTDAGPTVWRYTVKAGESISTVAIRFGTSTDNLIALNPEYAGNQDLIQAGAQIIVPCTPLAVQEGRC
jgi:hypothetical protein